MSRWHVMKGVGESNLTTIAHDIRTYQRNRASAEMLLSSLTLKSDTVSIAAANKGLSRIGQDYILEAVRGGYVGDITHILDGLDLRTKRDILIAHISNLSLSHIQALEKGTGFDMHKRARVEVIAEGVTKQTSIRMDYDGLNVEHGGLAEIGEVHTGRILEFTSRPAVGGFIALDRFATTYMQGLVDPQSGEPRVHIDILAKS
jgi:hypothetical protein